MHLRLRILLILTVFVLTACALGSDSPRSIAEKTVKAMINADWKTFNSLVPPDKRCSSGTGTCLGIGAAEVTAVALCRDISAEYLERVSPDVQDGREVTVKFQTPCIQLDSANRTDKLILTMEKVNNRGSWEA